jgi:hypothetical protein
MIYEPCGWSKRVVATSKTGRSLSLGRKTGFDPAAGHGRGMPRPYHRLLQIQALGRGPGSGPSMKGFRPMGTQWRL